MNKRYNKCFGVFSFVAAIFFGFVWCAEAGLGIAVYPSRIRLEKQPGESVSGRLRVDNEGTYPFRLETEVTDLISRVSPEGLLFRDEAPPGTSSYSCAKWIQITSGEGIVVPPGEFVDVDFLISPPPEVSAGGYSAYLFVFGRPAALPGDREGAEDAAVRLVTIPRLGVSVIYEVEGTVQRTGEISDVQFTPPKQGEPMKIRYEFENTGNAEVWLSGTFHVLDEMGLLAGKGTLKTLKTLPGDKGAGETFWQDPLKPGLYTALLTFEIGPDTEDVIVREIEFEITEAITAPAGDQTAALATDPNILLASGPPAPPTEEIVSYLDEAGNVRPGQEPVQLAKLEPELAVTTIAQNDEVSSGYRDYRLALNREGLGKTFLRVVRAGLAGSSEEFQVAQNVFHARMDKAAQSAEGWKSKTYTFANLALKKVTQVISTWRGIAPKDEQVTT